MDIQNTDAAPFKVIRLLGDVDLHSSPAARQAILDALKSRRPLLVDLSGVSYMDSSGVANLVEGYQLAKKLGLEFGLAAPSVPVLNVIKLARLDRVFAIHASVQERLDRAR